MKPWVVERVLTSINFFLIGLLCLTAGLLIKEWFFPAPPVRVSLASDQRSPVALSFQSDEPLVFKGSLLGPSKLQEEALPSIKVRGIASSGSKGFAVVEKDGLQTLVHEGTVLGAWTVQKITHEALFLKDGGGKEVRLEPDVTQFKTQTLAKEKTDFPSPHLGQTSLELDETTVRNILSHWADIFREARFFPYVEEGVTLGYVILDLQPNSLVQRLGLRIGDIVQRINGKSITDLGSLAAIYDHLEGGELTIDVKRGPKNIQLVYQLNRDKRLETRDRG